jgi:hypothetical protein
MTNDWEKAHVEACRTIQALMARVAELEAELGNERANGPTAEEWRRTHERAKRAEAEAAALRETLEAAVKRVADRLAAREVEDTDAPVSPPGPETSGLPR